MAPAIAIPVAAVPLTVRSAGVLGVYDDPLPPPPLPPHPATKKAKPIIRTALPSFFLESAILIMFVFIMFVSPLF
jgi:hypothetical protein